MGGLHLEDERRMGASSVSAEGLATGLLSPAQSSCPSTGQARSPSQRAVGHWPRD